MSTLDGKVAHEVGPLGETGNVQVIGVNGGAAT